MGAEAHSRARLHGHGVGGGGPCTVFPHVLFHVPASSEQTGR